VSGVLAVALSKIVQAPFVSTNNEKVPVVFFGEVSPIEDS